MLSCLHLLNSLSMYEEPACVIRGRLSGQVLTAAKHTHRALESLEVCTVVKHSEIDCIDP